MDLPSFINLEIQKCLKVFLGKLFSFFCNILSKVILVEKSFLSKAASCCANSFLNKDSIKVAFLRIIWNVFQNSYSQEKSEQMFLSTSMNCLTHQRPMQRSNYIKTIKLICFLNQLTGFYMVGALMFTGEDNFSFSWVLRNIFRAKT